MVLVLSLHEGKVVSASALFRFKRSVQPRRISVLCADFVGAVAQEIHLSPEPCLVVSRECTMIPIRRDFWSTSPTSGRTNTASVVHDRLIGALSSS